MFKLLKTGSIFIREFALGIKNVFLYGAYQPRYYFPIDKKKVVYLDIPKVANTSIKASIMGFKDKEYSVTEVHILASEKGVNELSELQKGYHKFTFVRNPFERLVSCYESKYHTDKKELKDHLWYDYYLFGYIRKDKGFDHFVKKIYRIPDYLKDFHFLPQYNIVYNKSGKSRVNDIGKLEHISELYPQLQKKYGFDDLPHLNQSEKKVWMDYYTKETAALAYRMYRKDIEAFGYKSEYRKLLRYLRKKNAGKG